MRFIVGSAALIVGYRLVSGYAHMYGPHMWKYACIALIITWAIRRLQVRIARYRLLSSHRQTIEAEILRRYRR